MMVTLAWEPDHRRSVGHAVEAFDGRKIATFEDYFDDRACPACGFSTRGDCTFAFYRLEIDRRFAGDG